MLRPSITLGRIGGVAIGVNWTWLIIFGLIVWSLAAGVFPSTNPGLGGGAYAAMAATASLLFFTSILLHELGHAAQAKREGMQVEGITLWVFGGVARFSGMFPSAGAEFRVAIAGPLVTTAIAAVLLPASALLPLPSAVDGVVAWLGRINLLLLAFNMLPAFPLDGGRVLRSLLWRWRLDHLFEDLVASGERRDWTPAIDVIRDEDNIAVRVDMPGIQSEDIKGRGRGWRDDFAWATQLPWLTRWRRHSMLHWTLSLCACGRDS